jgi:phosphoglycerate kinase
MIRSINDVSFYQKTALIRVDFNVPLGKDQSIADDLRIQNTLPTLDKIIDDGGIPVLMSHLGRPKGAYNPAFSLRPVAEYLVNYYGYDVVFAEDCIGEIAEKAVHDAAIGQVVVLENLRYHPEEKENDLEFAKKLAKLGDIYVNDAFGTAHRAHASTDAVARLYDKRFAGYLMIDEVEYLGNTVSSPARPFVAVMGGAKISGKIDVIRNLISKCDAILIGGGMTYTFFEAMGLEIGNSLLEKDKVVLAKELIELAKKEKCELLLPIDNVVADKFDNEANFKTVGKEEIPRGWLGVDIGEDTRDYFSETIINARTIIWNGPMGVFEMPNFAAGTLSIAKALAEATKKGAITIIGGGDSAAAIRQMKFQNRVTHVSTGGGASLEYLEGKVLPGVAALDC